MNKFFETKEIMTVQEASHIYADYYIYFIITEEDEDCFSYSKGYVGYITDNPFDRTSLERFDDEENTLSMSGINVGRGNFTNIVVRRD